MLVVKPDLTTILISDRSSNRKEGIRLHNRDGCHARLNSQYGRDGPALWSALPQSYRARPTLLLAQATAANTITISRMIRIAPPARCNAVFKTQIARRSATTAMKSARSFVRLKSPQFTLRACADV
jgi:hypothetical protein